jgi:NitT/TauT family transport system substrate-binding protein
LEAAATSKGLSLRPVTARWSSRAARCAAAAAAIALCAPLTASSQESEQIVVLAPAIDSSGQIFYAQDLGLYKEAGLNVKVQIANNPGVTVPAVMGGSATFGSVSIPGIALARAKNIPIVVVAPGDVYSSATPNGGLIVLKDSPLKKASDLDGKTIGTRDLTNLSYYATQAWIDKNGGDAKTVKWVELNDTVAVPALVAHRVDAACASEPALDAAILGPDAKARLFAKMDDAIAKKFMISAVVSTAAYAQAHPEIVRKFAAAIIKAGIWANSHHAESAAILNKYAGVSFAPGSTRAIYAEQVRPSDAQPVLDILAQFGVIKPTLRAGDLFARNL